MPSYHCIINETNVILQSSGKREVFSCGSVERANAFADRAVKRCADRGFTIKVNKTGIQTQPKPDSHASDAQHYAASDVKFQQENFFKKYYQNNPFGDFYKQQ